MKEVTAAVIMQDGKVLLTRRAKDETMAGYWEFPGGKMEAGESPQACLERELHEELGIVARAGSLVIQSEYHYGQGAIRLLALSAEILDGRISLSVHDRMAWVLPDQLTTYKLSPADIPVAEKIMDMVRIREGFPPC